MKSDVIVLGAGMVGISAALHLLKRGRSVALIDRRGAAEETSYGNGGIIQREGVVPYMFPRELGTILHYALNRAPEAVYHLSALPTIAPWLFRHWLASTAEGKAASARALRPLVENCITEHEPLLAEAGVMALIRRTGYLKLYRTEAKLAEVVAIQEKERVEYGVNAITVGKAEIAALEPHLRDGFAGGIHMLDPISVSDPGAIGKAYNDLFVRKGGQFLEGDARSLESTSAGWRVATRQGWWEGAEVIVALGPWSDDVLRPLGYRFPLGWKRGYHMHYRTEGNAVLSRPVVDGENGFAIMSMSKGLRLTTGAEFGLRDAPKTPIQIERTEKLARQIFPIAERVEPEPWLGRRPCLPDMLPVIGPAGRHKGLWLSFGHHHLGFTLGPVSGRLLAEMMTGETPFTDPTPYRADRF